MVGLIHALLGRRCNMSKKVLLIEIKLDATEGLKLSDSEQQLIEATGNIIRHEMGDNLMEYSVTIKTALCNCDNTDPNDLAEICLNCGATLKYE